jgi:hypothetical protein
MGATLQESIAAGEFGVTMIRPANPQTFVPGRYDVLLDDGHYILCDADKLDRELPDWRSLLRSGRWLEPEEYDNAKLQTAQRAWAECGGGYPLYRWHMGVGGHVLAWGKPPHKRRVQVHAFLFAGVYGGAALEGIHRAPSPLSLRTMINGQPANRYTHTLQYWNRWVSPYVASYFQEG